MMIKKIISGLLTIIPLLAITANAIVLEVPSSQWQADVAVTWPTLVQADESSFFELIQNINQYLWFSLWVVCMAVLIVWWYKLMTAQGDDAKMKQANKLLMWALIGILIAILSYAIIRLVVNLFA